MGTIRCKCCGKIVRSNPRVKNQRYCSEKTCQRERKRLWQKQKIKADPDYRANQKDCQQRWCQKNPDYWRNWRSAHPSRPEKTPEKMDTFIPKTRPISGFYLLIPLTSRGAKMDASGQNVFILSTR